MYNQYWIQYMIINDEIMLILYIVWWHDASRKRSNFDYCFFKCTNSNNSYQPIGTGRQLNNSFNFKVSFERIIGFIVKDQQIIYSTVGKRSRRCNSFSRQVAHDLVWNRRICSESYYARFAYISNCIDWSISLS